MSNIFTLDPFEFSLGSKVMEISSIAIASRSAESTNSVVHKNPTSFEDFAKARSHGPLTMKVPWLCPINDLKTTFQVSQKD